MKTVRNQPQFLFHSLRSQIQLKRGYRAINSFSGGDHLSYAVQLPIDAFVVSPVGKELDSSGNTGTKVKLLPGSAVDNDARTKDVVYFESPEENAIYKVVEFNSSPTSVGHYLYIEKGPGTDRWRETDGVDFLFDFGNDETVV